MGWTVARDWVPAQGRRVDLQTELRWHQQVQGQLRGVGQLEWQLPQRLLSLALGPQWGHPAALQPEWVDQWGPDCGPRLKGCLLQGKLLQEWVLQQARWGLPREGGLQEWVLLQWVCWGWMGWVLGLWNLQHLCWGSGPQQARLHPQRMLGTQGAEPWRLAVALHATSIRAHITYTPRAVQYVHMKSPQGTSSEQSILKSGDALVALCQP